MARVSAPKGQKVTGVVGTRINHSIQVFIKEQVCFLVACPPRWRIKIVG